ncbi:hypothetical protein HN587_01250 [Candidatus Woesearchaeota archaeon]|jgi:hypothetical protein|nr:hypothetical protein [Candidatus Woesearchaeota archaeon]
MKRFACYGMDKVLAQAFVAAKLLNEEPNHGLLFIDSTHSDLYPDQTTDSNEPTSIEEVFANRIKSVAKQKKLTIVPLNDPFFNPNPQTDILTKLALDVVQYRVMANLASSLIGITSKDATLIVTPPQFNVFSSEFEKTLQKYLSGVRKENYKNNINPFMPQEQLYDSINSLLEGTANPPRCILTPEEVTDLELEIFKEILPDQDLTSDTDLAAAKLRVYSEVIAYTTLCALQKPKLGRAKFLQLDQYKQLDHLAAQAYERGCARSRHYVAAISEALKQDPTLEVAPEFKQTYVQ